MDCAFAAVPSSGSGGFPIGRDGAFCAIRTAGRDNGAGFLGGGSGTGTVVGVVDAVGKFVVLSGALGTDVFRGVCREELVAVVVWAAAALVLERGCFPFPCEDMGGVAVWLGSC